MFSWQSASDRHPRSGRQRIHEFARKGSWRWVRKLIQQGVSVNTLDRFGFTALHHAVLSTDLQTVLICLPRDSPIGEATAITHAARDRTTALHLATKLGMVEAAHAIIDYADWMVKCRVMEAWERQALLDARTHDGKTALALATIRGALQIVSHLGRCGAAPDRADRVTRSTPTHWAERMNDKTSMRLLLAYGADIDAQNGAGRRPLQELEVLKEFRGAGRHNIAAGNATKFAYERNAVVIDARYKSQKVMI
eukprot:jgi/Ulvmu1/78/UM001_0081.1